MNCERCGKKLGSNVYDIHTCTPIKKEWVNLTSKEREKLRDEYGDDPSGLISVVQMMLKEKNDN